MGSLAVIKLPEGYYAFGYNEEGCTQCDLNGCDENMRTLCNGLNTLFTLGHYHGFVKVPTPAFMPGDRVTVSSVSCCSGLEAGEEATVVNDITTSKDKRDHYIVVTDGGQMWEACSACLTKVVSRDTGADFKIGDRVVSISEGCCSGHEEGEVGIIKTVEPPAFGATDYDVEIDGDTRSMCHDCLELEEV